MSIIPRKKKQLLVELHHVEGLLEKLGGVVPPSGKQGKISPSGLTAKGLPPKSEGPRAFGAPLFNSVFGLEIVR